MSNLLHCPQIDSLKSHAYLKERLNSLYPYTHLSFYFHRYSYCHIMYMEEIYMQAVEIVDRQRPTHIYRNHNLGFKSQ